MFGLEVYKNIFGKPNEGLHKYKIFDIAIIDVLFTLLFAYLIQKYYDMPLIYIFLILIFIGIIAHKLFDVKTGLNNMIFN